MSAQEVLDLVKAARNRRVDAEITAVRVSDVSVSRERMVYRALPLSLTLVSVFPRDVPYGAELIYEVKVKNTGTANIAFPWSPERIDEQAKPLYAILSLATQDMSGDQWFIASVGIYGTTDAPGSIKLLKPGEEVMIRAGGPLQMVSVDKVAPILASLPRGLPVRAGLSFLSGMPSENRVPISSANSLKLEVLPPRTP